MASLHSSNEKTTAPGTKVSAVCISRNSETWNVSEIPFYNYTEGWEPFQHEQTTDRVRYLAGRRNAAVSGALVRFPETRHVLMIDSYYLHQEEQIRGLIRDYADMTISNHPGGCILGASTWFYDLRRVRPTYRFYDGWTTPEGNPLKLAKVERSGGVIRVKSIGSCYVFPRWVWEKYGYGVLEDLHGCEHNWLCEHSGLPVYMSLDRRLSRGPIRYPWVKRIRVSLHLGRFIGRRGSTTK
jgi:hypothetical protein